MGRAPCCDKSRVKKGPWSPEEDAKLKSYIEKHGTGGNWISLPHKIGLKRCGKSCRLRWLNYLRPNIKHGGFSEEEDNFICNLYFSIGSRWSIIAAQLPGRTDNDIKNYWNTKLKKKLLLGNNNNNNNMKQYYYCRKTNQIIRSTTTTPRSLVSRHHQHHVKQELISNNDHNINNFLVDYDHDHFRPPHVLPPITSFPITTTTSSEQMVYGGNYSTTTTTTSSSSSSAANNNNNNIIIDDDQGLIMPPSLLQVQPNNYNYNYNYINSSTFLDHRLLEYYYLDIGNINMKKNIMFLNNGSYMSCTTAASPSPEDMIISSDADEVAMPPPPHQDYFTFRQEEYSTTYTDDNLINDHISKYIC